MRTFFTIALCLMAFVAQSVAQEITDLNILKQGGYVLIFRHATAPGGDPPAGSGNDTNGAFDSLWWMQCDATKSRQLSAVGRTEAITIGQAMKRLGMKVGKVASSEFCRCYETANLMNTGRAVQTTIGLTMTLYTEAERTIGMNTLASETPTTGTSTVLVTHGIAFSDTLYNRISSLAWGDAAVYRAQLTGGRPDFVGFIRVATWGRVTTVQAAAAEPQNEITINIAPNPTAESITVHSSCVSCKAVVVNVLGQKLLESELHNGSTQLLLKDIPAGVYMLYIFDGEGKRSIAKQIVRN